MDTSLTAQSTTPTPSRAILMDVLARGLQAHPELSVRLDKAASIVESGGVQRGLAGGGWWVRSQSIDREYWVVLGPDYRRDYCSCPDSQTRGGCKHALACRLLLACERREARLQAATERHVTPAPACGPAPIPFPPRAYSDADRFALTPKGEAYLDGRQVPTPAA